MPRLALGHRAPTELLDAEVLDAAGRAAPLRAHLGASAPALLVFLRHFGCIGCARALGELAPRLPELHALGLRTICVGNGTPAHLAGFVARHSLEGRTVTVVTDPTLRAFRAAGLRRSLWATLGPRALWTDLQALARGYQGRGFAGDLLQQGGAVLLDRDGVVAFHHANRATADGVDPSDVIEAALRVLCREERQRGAPLL